MPDLETEVEALFPLSWIDRLIRWIERLPGPVWIFYLLGVVAVVVLVNITLWIDGSVPFGEPGSIRGVFPPVVFYFLALYHYLTGAATRSLQAFRPLLDQEDSGVARIEKELTVLPRRWDWLAIPVGISIFVPPYALGYPLAYENLDPQTQLPVVLSSIIAVFFSYTFMCVVIRSIRQLWKVHELHTRVENISLLNLEPAHAFSGFTARAGIGLYALFVFGYFYAPEMFDSTLIVLFYLAVTLVTILIFAVPILGIRDRLDQEKKRALGKNGELLEAARERLHEGVRSDQYQHMKDIRDAAEALIRERELLERIPTWPWDPRTIRSFASALLLPIVIWLITRLLDRVL